MAYPDRYLFMLEEKFMSLVDEGYDAATALGKMIEFHDQEQAISWNTTCIGCARLLDRLYAQDVEQGNI